MALPAQASNFSDGGLTLVWVKVKAYPGENVWQACRRVYQRDVYKAAPWHGHKVRCKIEHTRLYDYGSRYRNFN